MNGVRLTSVIIGLLFFNLQFGIAAGHASRPQPNLIILRSPVPTGSGVIISPNGRYIASAGAIENPAQNHYRGIVTIWDLKTRKVLHVVRSDAISIYSMAFSPDSRTLAAGTHDETTYMWDARFGGSRGFLRGGGNRVFGLAFSPDGKTLYGACYHGFVAVWSLKTRTMTRSMGQYHRSSGVSVSPDGKLVAAGVSYASVDPDKPHRDNDPQRPGEAVKVWNVNPERLYATLEAESPNEDRHDQITGVAFSPDGRLLAVCSEMAIRLWDVRRRRIARTILSDKNGLPFTFSPTFSPDGKTLATCSDGLIRLWNVKTGRLKTAWRPSQGAGSLAFAPDGKTLAFAVGTNRKGGAHGVALMKLD